MTLGVEDLMIGESLKFYILGSCHLKRKCKSHTNNHFPNISGVENPKKCETTTIGIIPKPTDKVFEGMIFSGPFYTSSLSNLDVKGQVKILSWAIPLVPVPFGIHHNNMHDLGKLLHLIVLYWDNKETSIVHCYVTLPN